MPFTEELCECGHPKSAHFDRQWAYADWRLLALKTRLGGMPLWMVVKRKDYLLAAMKATEAELALRLLPRTDMGGKESIQENIQIAGNGSCKLCDCKEFKCKEFVY